MRSDCILLVLTDKRIKVVLILEVFVSPASAIDSRVLDYSGALPCSANIFGAIFARTLSFFLESFVCWNSNVSATAQERTKCADEGR
jgi:hypothetical protein